MSESPRVNLKITVDWFKQSGKWYAKGEFVTEESAHFSIVEEFEEMLSRGTRPGLVDCRSLGNEFFAVLYIPVEDVIIPQMFRPDYLYLK